MTDNAKPPFDVQVSADGTEAVIRPAHGEVRVSASELDDAIAWLGQLRSTMRPPVASALPKDARLLPLSDFLFLAPASGEPPTTRGVTLTVRSEYFGWLQLQFSPEHCADLAAWLSGQTVGAPRGATLN